MKCWYFDVIYDYDDYNGGGGGDGDLKTTADQTVRRNRFLLTRNRRMDMHI
jgi:hypothetical protein